MSILRSGFTPRWASWSVFVCVQSCPHVPLVMYTFVPPEAVFAVHRVPSLNLVPRARFVNTPLHRVLAPVRACRVWDWLG